MKTITVSVHFKGLDYGKTSIIGNIPSNKLKKIVSKMAEDCLDSILHYKPMTEKETVRLRKEHCNL